MPSDKKSIFKDSKLNKEFDENGFIVLSLLNSDDVRKLLDLYTSNPPKEDFSFYTTHFSIESSYKKKINDKIIEVFSNHLDNILLYHKPIFANFMTKKANGKNVMPLHADWTYVNENEETSLAIWCTLIDTDISNGMLGVIPRSHKFNNTIRGPKIPSPYHDFNEYIIKTYGELKPMKAGDILIYDHRLLHYSPANKSCTDRIALNITLTPPFSTIHHYAIIFDDQISHFEISDNEFFTDYHHFQNPTSKYDKRNEIPYRKIEFTKSEIDKTLNPTNTLLSLIRKLLSFI